MPPSIEEEKDESPELEDAAEDETKTVAQYEKKRAFAHEDEGKRSAEPDFLTGGKSSCGKAVKHSPFTGADRDIFVEENSKLKRLTLASSGKKADNKENSVL